MEQGRRENEKDKNKGIREGGKNGWREEGGRNAVKGKL